jgi:hypothetical protein
VIGRDVLHAPTGRKLRLVRYGSNGIMFENIRAMRGITYPIQFEHGGYRCNAAGWRLTACGRPAILCRKTSQ